MIKVIVRRIVLSYCKLHARLHGTASAHVEGAALKGTIAAPGILRGTPNAAREISCFYRGFRAPETSPATLRTRMFTSRSTLA